MILHFRLFFVRVLYSVHRPAVSPRNDYGVKYLAVRLSHFHTHPTKQATRRKHLFTHTLDYIEYSLYISKTVSSILHTDYINLQAAVETEHCQLRPANGFVRVRKEGRRLDSLVEMVLPCAVLSADVDLHRIIHYRKGTGTLHGCC